MEEAFAEFLAKRLSKGNDVSWFGVVIAELDPVGPLAEEECETPAPRLPNRFARHDAVQPRTEATGVTHLPPLSPGALQG